MLGLEKHVHSGSLKGEKQFSIISDESDDGTELVLTVHPWSRDAGDESVFVGLGWFTPKGEEPEDLENPNWNAIVDRESFVEGILHAFPELKRAD